MLGVNDGRTLGAGSECMKALNFVRFCQFLFLRLGHFAVPATLYGSVALLISSPASAITFPNLYSLGLWHVVSETGQPQSVVSILCFHKISTDFYKCAWVCMCACVCVHASVGNPVDSGASGLQSMESQKSKRDDLNDHLKFSAAASPCYLLTLDL